MLSPFSVSSLCCSNNKETLISHFVHLVLKDVANLENSCYAETLLFAVFDFCILAFISKKLCRLMIGVWDLTSNALIQIPHDATPWHFIEISVLWSMRL